MAKACINHRDQVSVTMCHQCHRPICGPCTTVTPYGSFCSSECGLRHREFRERMAAGGGRGPSSGLAMKLFLVLLLAVLAIGGIHVAAKKGYAFARLIDLIGLLFEKVEAAKPK